MTPASRLRERGAALIVAVLLAAALSIVAGAVTWFASMGARTSAAARDRAEVDDAVEVAMALAAGALAVEPDLDAVRRGDVVAPGNGVDAIDTVDGRVDVAALERALGIRRRRLAAPHDTAVWRPYLWGRAGALLATPAGASIRDPLVVVWVRGDGAAALGSDRLEIAADAITASGARAAAVAVVRLGPRGAAMTAIWRDGGIAGAG